MKVKPFLTTNEEFEKSFFVVPKFGLSFLGFWPEQNAHSLLKLRRFINLTVLAAAFTFEFAFGYSHILQDYLNALDAICPASTKVVTFFKLLKFIHLQSQLNACVTEIRLQIQEMAKTSQRLQTVQQNHVMVKMFAKTIFICSIITSSAYCMRPLVNSYFATKTDAALINIDMPFNVLLPSRFMEQVSYFVPAYLCLTYSAFVTPFGFCCIDSFFLEACQYISSLFDLLGEDIEHLFDNVVEHDGALSDEENHIVWLRLRQIICRQNAINALCDKLRRSYTMIIVSHFVSSAIIIGLGTLDMMTNTGFGIFLYGFYTISVLFELLMYCISGTLVMESSVKIAEKLYDIKWYQCDKNIRRRILIMLIKSQQPISMEVPFFNPTLEAFTAVMGSVGSFIALLKTFL